MRDILHAFFFFNDTATTEIYTLSLHDALPISCARSPNSPRMRRRCSAGWRASRSMKAGVRSARRSEEHTSELQSQSNLVCRLLLEKKKNELLEIFGLGTSHNCLHLFSGPVKLF